MQTRKVRLTTHRQLKITVPRSRVKRCLKEPFIKHSQNITFTDDITTPSPYRQTSLVMLMKQAFIYIKGVRLFTKASAYNHSRENIKPISHRSCFFLERGYQKKRRQTLQLKAIRRPCLAETHHVERSAEKARDCPLMSPHLNQWFLE